MALGFTCSTNSSPACQPPLVCGSWAAHSPPVFPDSWERGGEEEAGEDAKGKKANTLRTQRGGSQSVAQASSSRVTRKLVKMQILRSYPDLTGPETRAGVQPSRSAEAFHESDACYSRVDPKLNAKGRTDMQGRTVVTQEESSGFDRQALV